jgi:hypothetical protein
MQGIMALSGAPEVGAQGAPQMDVDPAAMAAFEASRAQINPEEFGTELLKAGEQIDPMELKSLRNSLKSANLSPQIVDAIGQMVDAVLAEPEKYAELRAGFLAEGVPEDLLPAEFDGGFFAALNLALDQINTSFKPDTTEGLGSLPMGATMPEAAPQAFAKGGIAQLKPLAAEMAKMGRKGDSMLAHITPSEARMLRRNGGSGTTNPMTGLPEFFLGNLFKKVGSAFKSVGKAVVKGVKSVVSGVKKFAKSTIGRVVIGAALFYFAGPAAFALLGPGASAVAVGAFQGFAAGFGSTLLAGKGIKEALKIGAIGGVTAGLTQGIMGGAEAFSAGSYTGPQTFGAAVDNLVSGAKNLVGAGTPPPSGAEVFNVPGPETGFVNQAPGTTMPGTSLNLSSPQVDMGYQANPFQMQPQAGAESPFTYTAQAQGAPVPSSVGTSTFTPDAAGAAAPGSAGGLTTQQASDLMQSNILPAGQQTPAVGGAEKGFFGNLFDKIVPGSPSEADLIQKGLDAVKKLPAGTPESIQRSVYEAASKAPSAISKYAPLALGAVGIMGLSGGFKQPESEQPNITGGLTGQQLLDQDPAKYGLPFGGVNTTYATPTPYYNPQNYQRQTPDPYAMQPVQPVKAFADGGPSNVDGYPRKQGAINGPGTGTSDSIKALLSDGEFVFTAKAVRGAGQGSRRKGAKRMYQLMRSLEGKA